MRLITSQVAINDIAKIAIEEFKRHLRDGEFIASNNEFNSPLWRELVYDLVRLAIVAYPITKKFRCAIIEQHKRQQTEDLELWESIDHYKTESIITHGLSSISSVDFVTYVLSPDMVHDAHMSLYEQFEQPIGKAPWPPAEEWSNAYRVAESYMLLGGPVATSQKYLEVILPDPELF